MSIYRRLYEQHFGPIPKDEQGRTYDIHHKDGNHKNNDPSNLVALSIEEHYKVHYDRGDKGACLAISMRMDLSPEEKSDIARKSALQRVENGTHNWLDSDKAREQSLKRVKDGSHPFLDREKARERTLKRSKDGTNPFLDGEKSRERALKRIEEGTHNFLGPETNRRRIENGTHNFLNKLTCPVCNKSMSQGLYNRWGHGEIC
jgi:Lhr-like helicase